jgi:hypothetical protein
MNIQKIIGISGIAACLVSSSLFAGPPAGVGSAETSEGVCFDSVVVGPPGNHLAFLDGVHGVMNVELGRVKAVEANSANGTASFTCHGTIAPGDLIQGFDIVTGLPAEATAVETKDACVALAAFGLGHACRGNNNGAVILNAEFMGGSCNWGSRSTLDWTSVRTPSGKTMLSCHFSD